MNALAPGMILGTSFHNTHTTPEPAKATAAGIPLGRGGNADDVARAAVFLAGEYDASLPAPRWISTAVFTGADQARPV